MFLGGEENTRAAYAAPTLAAAYGENAGASLQFRADILRTGARTTSASNNIATVAGSGTVTALLITVPLIVPPSSDRSC